MTIDTKTNAQPVGALTQVGAAADKRGQRVDKPVYGAAFRALLERLEESARALDRASDRIADPRELGAAVASARATVEEALSAGGDLLEAYRASQARAVADTEATSNQTRNSNGSGWGR